MNLPVNFGLPVKVRLPYEIKGRLRFLSHLETVAALERALRVQQLNGCPLVTTEGFSPKLKVSYSDPRSVGMGSVVEHADVSLSVGNVREATLRAEGLVRDLNVHFNGGLRFRQPIMFPERTRADAVVTAYVLAPKFGRSEEVPVELQKPLSEVFKSGNVLTFNRKGQTLNKEVEGSIQLLNLRRISGAYFVFVRHDLSSGNYLPPMVLAAALEQASEGRLELANVRRIGYS